MSKYSGIRNTIKVPEVLSNPNGLANIIHITKKLIEQVEIEN